MTVRVAGRACECLVFERVVEHVYEEEGSLPRESRVERKKGERARIAAAVTTASGDWDVGWMLD